MVRQTINLAMGVYTVLMSIGFMIAFPVVGAIVTSSGWRQAWSSVGFALLILAPLGWMLVRHTPESSGLMLDGKTLDGEKANDNPPEALTGFTLRQALLTPAFYGICAFKFGLWFDRWALPCSTNPFWPNSVSQPMFIIARWSSRH